VLELIEQLVFSQGGVQVPKAGELFLGVPFHAPESVVDHGIVAYVHIIPAFKSMEKTGKIVSGTPDGKAGTFAELMAQFQVLDMPALVEPSVFIPHGFFLKGGLDLPFITGIETPFSNDIDDPGHGIVPVKDPHGAFHDLNA